MSKESLATRVINSVFFKNSIQKANGYKGSMAVLELLKEVLTKTKTIAGKQNKGIGQVLADKIMLLSRLVKYSISGDYKDLQWKTLLKILAVLIYFVSPLDLIPDLIPVLGLTDDLALITWLITALGEEIENFEKWEKNHFQIK
ncbi:MAG: DUF1232 domain-containing protein [Pseudarcicella sp.]|nr:DUF1232 domain-containing protein [Pseudarcicella sp.]MBP6411053.1 DUF1232 domain-containing protein [Pseudarcicella sp.]